MSIFNRFKRKKQQSEASQSAAGTDAERPEGKIKAASSGQKTSDKREKTIAQIKSEKTVVKAVGKKKRGLGGISYRLLEEPVISEKSAHLSADNQYVFIIHPQANKMQVRDAIEEIYGVRPMSVNIINVPGKRVTTRGRYRGRTKGYKKAVIRLKKGQEIKVYEGV